MSGRPQWEIDAIDAMEDARLERRALARLQALIATGSIYGNQRKVKKGRGQRRNRRNRR